MFQNMKLGTKLILTFMSIATTTLVLGVMGYHGTLKSEASINEVGAVRLPGIETVLKMQVELESLVGGMRTLLNPDNTREIRQEQYDHIAKTRERYGQARTLYETLSHTPEEVQEWNEFLRILPEWVGANDEILKLSRQLDEMDILRPTSLLAQLQTFRGDHLELEARIARLVLSGEALDGGDDPTACRLGKWLAQFSTRNSHLQGIARAAHQHHNRFHETVRTIRDRMQAGKREECEQLFATAMQPAAHEVANHLAQLIAEVA